MNVKKIKEYLRESNFIKEARNNRDFSKYQYLLVRDWQGKGPTVLKIGIDKNDYEHILLDHNPYVKSTINNLINRGEAFLFANISNKESFLALIKKFSQFVKNYGLDGKEAYHYIENSCIGNSIVNNRVTDRIVRDYFNIPESESNGGYNGCRWFFSKNTLPTLMNCDENLAQMGIEYYIIGGRYYASVEKHKAYLSGLKKIFNRYGFDIDFEGVRLDNIIIEPRKEFKEFMNTPEFSSLCNELADLIKREFRL